MGVCVDPNLKYLKSAGPTRKPGKNLKWPAKDFAKDVPPRILAPYAIKIRVAG